MGLAVTLVPKGLGPQNPTKNWPNLVDLMGQTLSRKPVFKIFGPESVMSFYLRSIQLLLIDNNIGSLNCI